MSSHPRKPELGLNYLSDRLRDSLACEPDKPDFRELDLGSPVSPLVTRQTGVNIVAANTTTSTTTSSSSNSSGSVSGVNVPGPIVQGPNNHSGELSGSSDNSPTAGSGKAPRAFGSVQTRSEAGGYPANQGAVNSPLLNVLPAGNICPSGRILKKEKDSNHTPHSGTGSNHTSRPDVLGSGSGNYGHGSILRGGGPTKGSSRVDSGAPSAAYAKPNPGVGDTGRRMAPGSIGGPPDSEEMNRLGNEHYKKGNFLEALELYDKAIRISPGKAAYRSNRAAALMGLGRLGEAVADCEVAVRLDPRYLRAHQRLGSLYTRLGQIENAKRCLNVSGHLADANELQKLQILGKHINRCSDARKVCDWNLVLRECDSAIAAGADSSPQLFLCRVEALLKLHQLEEAEKSSKNIPKVGLLNESSAHARFFGMLSEAYPLFVQAHVELALGRFDSAISTAEKAGQIDTQNFEVSGLLKNVRLIARARARGNDLFKSERFTEACLAYGDGLRLDPSNSVLYCNRAACWFKLGQWEQSIEDCNQALQFQPNYAKALLRRAASNSKLERWEEAVRDYEILRNEIPDDNEVAEALFHAQIALKKSLGEEITNMKFGGEVEEVQCLEQFKSAISLQGVAVVYFKSASDSRCNQMSSFLDALCSRYPSISFLKVDVEECSSIANSESVRIVPTFKIYRNGYRVKEIVCPSHDVLEHSVRYYSSQI